MHSLDHYCTDDCTQVDSCAVVLPLLLDTFPGKRRRLHNNWPSRGDRRLVSVVPCSIWNEANANILLMFFPVSFNYLLQYYYFIFPLPNLILYLWTINDIYAVYFLWCIFWFYYSEIWNFISCLLSVHIQTAVNCIQHDHTVSVRSVCAVLTVLWQSAN